MIARQHDQLRRSLRSLSREGFRKVHVLRSPAQADAAVVVRERLLNDYRDRTGPFDVIGDVHGCRTELEALLGQLGYAITRDAAGRAAGAVPPDGRTALFLGDLVDRGPDSPGVLRLVMGMVAAGHALAVPGNHENKLTRALSGRNVQVSHGLAETLSQLAGEDEAFRKDVAGFCHGLVSHLVLDGGRLVVAHAGLKEAYHGRASGRVRSFALYGDTTGETDEFGLPVRYPWAHDYRGRAMVLYGHTPTPEPEWVNNTLCLDTGCVFGGRLTALRYPEKELVSVPAERVWYEPARPFLSPNAPGTAGDCDPASATGASPAAARREPGVLDITDVLGKRVIETGYQGRITVREENAAGALEVMSRFAVDPRWLLYLPPTMSPVRHIRPAGSAGASGRGIRGLPGRRRHRRALRGKAHGLAGRAAGLPRRGDGPGPVRRAGRPARGGVHPDRAAVLRTRAHPAAARRGTGRDRRGRALGRAGHWMDAARLRADALVGQGRGPAPAPVRRGRRRGAGCTARGRPAARRGGRPGHGRGGARRPDHGPGRQRRGVHRRLPPLLLAGGWSGRGARWRHSRSWPPRAPSTTSVITPGI